MFSWIISIILTINGFWFVKMFFPFKYTYFILVGQLTFFAQNMIFSDSSLITINIVYLFRLSMRSTKCAYFVHLIIHINTPQAFKNGHIRASCIVAKTWIMKKFKFNENGQPCLPSYTSNSRKQNNDIYLATRFWLAPGAKICCRVKPVDEGPLFGLILEMEVTRNI